MLANQMRDGTLQPDIPCTSLPSEVAWLFLEYSEASRSVNIAFGGPDGVCVHQLHVKICKNCVNSLLRPMYTAYPCQAESLRGAHARGVPVAVVHDEGLRQVLLVRKRGHLQRCNSRKAITKNSHNRNND